MAAVARMLGVNPEDIALENQSQDTGQQLMFILKKIVTLLLMPMSLCLGVLGVGILLSCGCGAALEWYSGCSCFLC